MTDSQRQVERWKAKTLGSCKNEVAKQFQLLVRIRSAAKGGLAECVSCGNCYHYKQMHGGHYISRTNSATLYDDRNVHPQCVRCNNFLGGNRDGYEQFMTDRYGADVIAELRQNASQPKQWTRLELAEMIVEFRREIKRQTERVER